MSRELTDTNSKFSGKDIPDGSHQFKVVSVSKKYGGANKDRAFFVWVLGYEGQTGEQVLMPNMMGDLLRILGCKETEPNKFDWDTEDVIYSQFVAVVSHEPDKKDPTKMRQQMKDFKKIGEQEEIQF
jgi:hypothetical protein